MNKNFRWYSFMEKTPPAEEWILATDGDVFSVGAIQLDGTWVGYEDSWFPESDDEFDDDDAPIGEFHHFSYWCLLPPFPGIDDDE